MDGSRVAYDVAGSYGAKTRCNTVYVWNVRRNATTRVSGRPTCGADNTSTGAGVRELALAGGRVAWIVNQGGNSESRDSLYVLAGAVRASGSSPPRSGPATSARSSPATGSAALSARAASWGSTTGRRIRAARSHRPGSKRSARGSTTSREGRGTMLAESTDGRAVAVLRQDGSLGVYSTRGALLRTILPQHGVTEVALRGDYLVVADHGRHARGLQLAFRQASCAPGASRTERARSTSAPGSRSTPRRSRAAATPGSSTFGACSAGKSVLRQPLRRAGLEHVQLEPVGLAYAFTGSRRTGPARSCSSRSAGSCAQPAARPRPS